MSRWLKTVIGVLVSIIAVLFVAGLIFRNVLLSTLPEYEGTLSSKNILKEINIYRDSTAVPYILAENEEDAAFALGFVHAQDRLFTMDIARRAGEGRLSEVFGPKTLPFDKMFRSVGIKETVNMLFAKLPENEKKLLQAYSNGINKYLNEAKGHYPIEFDALGYDPYEWKPEHSLIIGRMMAWELNISWWIDIAFTHLIQKLGEEKVREIIPEYPENAPVIIPPELKNYPEVDLALVENDRAFRKFIGAGGTHIGSNNWVVNNKLSKSGKPIIANDTHLAFSAPTKWYAVVLRGGNWKAEGFTIPGIPMVISGKNENISWAVTNIMIDDADFYLEKIDSTKKKYLVNDEWRPLKFRKEKIKVKDSLDVDYVIRSTHRGPIVSDIHLLSLFYPKANTNDAEISMRWMGSEYSTEFASFFRINNAKNFQEFREALKGYAVPGQNFVYADKDGNIGYVFGGHLPKREIKGPTFIFDGTTDKYDWKGFVPVNELPVLYNPQSNFIASANNKTVKDFPHHISNIWEPPSRYERIVQLLSSKEKHTIKDYKKYQMDFVSPHAKKITAYILNAFKGIKVNDKNMKLTLQLFEDWDYEMNEFSQVPAIYSVFYTKLLENIYMDELGKDLYNEFVFVANIPFRSLIEVLSDSSNSWLDDIKTPGYEDKNEIIRKSLDEALTELENRFGKDIKEWQWGKLHQVVFKHAFSGQLSLLDDFINIGPYPIGGDGTTIFNTEYAFNEGIEEYPRFDHEPFENDLGPNMRYVFDFGKPDEFHLILSTGQSGNVMSDHYRNMSEMWLRGEYLKLRTDEVSIRKNKNLLRILPE